MAVSGRTVELVIEELVLDGVDAGRSRRRPGRSSWRSAPCPGGARARRFDRRADRRGDIRCRRRSGEMRASLQRRCTCCGIIGPSGEGRAKRLRRRATGPRPALVPPIVHDVLRSPGRPLETAVRSEMERRLGYDLSRVRIHTDPVAAESARAVSALAYTVGRDIVFDRGCYAPSRLEGMRLLTHELAHTLQQDHASSACALLEILPPGSSGEREAEETARLASESPSTRTEGRRRTRSDLSLSLTRPVVARQARTSNIEVIKANLLSSIQTGDGARIIVAVDRAASELTVDQRVALVLDPAVETAVNSLSSTGSEIVRRRLGVDGHVQKRWRSRMRRASQGRSSRAEAFPGCRLRSFRARRPYLITGCPPPPRRLSMLRSPARASRQRSSWSWATWLRRQSWIARFSRTGRCGSVRPSRTKVSHRIRRLIPTAGFILPIRRFGPSAFSSAGWLYSTILHEYTHVLQHLPRASPARANPLLGTVSEFSPAGVGGGANLEVEAYAEEILLTDKTGVAASPDLVGILWDRLVWQINQVSALGGERDSKKPLVCRAFAAAEKVLGRGKLRQPNADRAGNPFCAR